MKRKVLALQQLNPDKKQPQEPLHGSGLSLLVC
jgi:hypothetical protein